MSPTPTLASSFFDYLLAHNQPQLEGFRLWLFQPGMRFQDPEIWWGEGGARPTPHEGLDLCWFEDASRRISLLDKHIKIPATFAGKILKIARDFLGKSIFLSHDLYDGDGRQLYTAYGHTRPLASLTAGQTVAAGEIIATLAPGAKKGQIPCHLHLTLAWIPPSLPASGLNWRNLSADRSITLLDPWSILARSK